MRIACAVLADNAGAAYRLAVRQFGAPARGLGSTTGRWLRGSGLRSGLAVSRLATVCGSATVVHGCTATENRPFSSVNYCYRVRWAAWGYAVVP